MHPYTPNSSFNRFLSTTHSPISIAIVVFFCIVSYYFLDQPIAWYMRVSLPSFFKEANEAITHLGNSTFYYIFFAFGFIFFKFFAHNLRWQNIFCFLLVTTLTPGMICTTLKMLLGRARPSLLYSDQLYGFTFFKTSALYLSFPSGHSTFIASFILALCFIFSRYWLLFILLLLVISSSRVFINAHYLSDVVAGIYLSVLVVPWIHQNFFVMEKNHESNYPN